MRAETGHREPPDHLLRLLIQSARSKSEIAAPQLSRAGRIDHELYVHLARCPQDEHYVHLARCPKKEHAARSSARAQDRVSQDEHCSVSHRVSMPLHAQGHNDGDAMGTTGHGKRAQAQTIQAWIGWPSKASEQSG